MGKAIQRLEKNLIGEAPKPTAPPKGLIKFSINVDLLSKYPSLIEVTIAFFADDFRGGYALDQRHESWNALDPQEKKSLTNKFTTIKRAVKIVLMHADDFPLMPTNPLQYKEEIRRIATAAEDRVRKDFDFGDKVITPNKLQRQLKDVPRFRETEMKGKLPDNTPEDWRRFFGNIPHV
jgi:hypothetical protein